MGELDDQLRRGREAAEARILFSKSKNLAHKLFAENIANELKASIAGSSATKDLLVQITASEGPGGVGPTQFCIEVLDAEPAPYLYEREPKFGEIRPCPEMRKDKFGYASSRKWWDNEKYHHYHLLPQNADLVMDEESRGRLIRDIKDDVVNYVARKQDYLAKQLSLDQARVTAEKASRKRANWVVILGCLIFLGALRLIAFALFGE